MISLRLTRMFNLVRASFSADQRWQIGRVSYVMWRSQSQFSPVQSLSNVMMPIIFKVLSCSHKIKRNTFQDLLQELCHNLEDMIFLSNKKKKVGIPEPGLNRHPA